MASSNHRTPPPAPTARPRVNIDEQQQRNQTASGTGGDTSKELPGGKDPRDPQYPGPYSTSENVTTDEQEAAQKADKESMTDAGTPYGSQATRAEQVESQHAAAENPLSPQSTSFNEPHGNVGGLEAPPRPEGQRDIVPRARKHLYDPATGAPTTHGHRRARLEAYADEDEERPDEEMVEVEVASPVNLTDDDGNVHHYDAGKQKIRASHRDHWYMKQHIKDTTPMPKKKADATEASDARKSSAKDSQKAHEEAGRK